MHKGLLKKSQGLSHFESTFYRYAGLVAGIHCQGEGLAFFSPRHFFSITFVYICCENAVKHYANPRLHLGFAQLSRILPTPLVFISGYANTGKKFSIAFIKQLYREKTQKLFVMVLIKTEILTSPKVLYMKSCTHNQFLFCKKMLSKIQIFLT